MNSSVQKMSMDELMDQCAETMLEITLRLASHKPFLCQKTQEACQLMLEVDRSLRDIS